MSDVTKEFEKSLRKLKEELMLSFIDGHISLEELYAKFQKIKFIEDYLKNEGGKLIFLDTRQIRELAGKTLYISLPQKITDFGWSKGDMVRLYLNEKNEVIILKKSN